MNGRRTAMALLACALAANGAFAQHSAPLTIMPGLEAQWVAPDMRLNGVPMRVRAFQGSMGTQAVLDYYQQRWNQDGRSELLRHQSWQVLSSQQDDRFVTLRVRPTAFGCEGFLVSSELPDATTKPVTNLPLPRGVRLVSHQSYRDNGHQGETLTLVSGQQPATLFDRFTQVLEHAGWQQRRAGPADTVSHAYRATFEHSKGALQLFIHRDNERYQGQTLILVQRQGASQ